MSIFSTKKDKEVKAESKKENVSVKAPSISRIFVLKHPRITEKASFSAEKGVYVFEVAKDANKKVIAEAVKEMYKVTPVRVNVVKIPAKRVIVRGKNGMKSGGKKAYVFLKKGDKIETM